MLGGAGRWLLNVEYRRDSKPERRSRHQVRDDTLVRLALVDLPELLFVVNFDSDAIFENILDMLATLDLSALIVLHSDHFLEV